MATEGPNEEYIMGDDDGELQRLTSQHALLKHEMSDQLVFAPIDFSQTGLRIFDSATADGTWLRELCQQIPNGTANKYVGIDIEASFIPKELPGWLQIEHESMQQQFRDEWTNTFDLVHMRFGLAAAAEWGPPKVIASLVTLVKPGGWAQLVEPDWRDTTGCGPALAELLTLFGEIFDKMGTGADYAQKLGTWLADNSLQKIETRSFTIRIGAKNPAPELGRAGAQVICQAATSMVKVATHMIPTSFSAEQLQTLVTRLNQELNSQGGSYRLNVAWGQKSRQS
ncbi:hypothetical protein LQW54_004527 [Pestalotiopsis sp. IQ-011]